MGWVHMCVGPDHIIKSHVKWCNYSLMISTHNKYDDHTQRMSNVYECSGG